MIGKIFKNKQLVTIVALMVCFGILVFAYRYRVDQAIHAVNVPVATRTLYARELIDDSCFTTRKVAQSMLTKNVIIDSKQLVGGANTAAKYVNYNTFIPEGSMFYDSAVVTWDKMPDSAWSDIEEGNTIVYLDIDSKTTYGNSIYPGDTIKLVFKYNGSGNDMFVGPLLSGIKVLAVKDSSGQHIFKRGPEQKNASYLVFSLSNKDFLFLERAKTVGGNNGIVPLLGNAEYAASEGEMSYESPYIVDFINKNSKKTEDDLEVDKKAQPTVKE